LVSGESRFTLVGYMFLFGVGVGILASFALWAACALRMKRVTHADSLRLQERMRIAQELHDTLLQSLVSASMQLDFAIAQLQPAETARPLFSRVLQLISQVTEESRNIVGGLRAPFREAQELELALSNVPRELGHTTSDVKFRAIVEGRPRSLHPPIRDEIYWIGREALVNAFRHAEARRIELEVCYRARQLRVVVRDDGCGIDPQVVLFGREGHLGVAGMRERAARIASKLEVYSRVGGGTEIELSVPGRVVFASYRPTYRSNNNQSRSNENE
jgi:signal transduction histidine kinase